MNDVVAFERDARRAVAERHGLMGELLREIETGERTAHQVTMREWLEGTQAA